MKHAHVKSIKDYTFAAALAGVLALPVAAHAEGTSAQKDAGASITAEQKFSAMDTDKSGAVSEAEFTAHLKTQNKGPEEAASTFKTLDADNDDRLTLAEVKNGTDAYKRTVQ